MSITNHFFNLIQCYSEQGCCYYKDYDFGCGTSFSMSNAIVPLCWLGLIALFILTFYFGRIIIMNCNGDKK